MGSCSCPALKSALLHRAATRDRAAQVAELLSKPKPEEIAKGAVLDIFFSSAHAVFMLLTLLSVQGVAADIVAK